jgi:hypothetical protein
MTDPELIAFVARKIMGWTVEADNYVGHWNPITDKNHTFEVVDRLRNWGYLVVTYHYGQDHGVYIDVRVKPVFHAEDRELGRAVCLAARQMVEG